MELLVWWTGNKAKSSRLRRAMIMWIVDGWWSDGDDGLRNWNGQMAIGVKCNGKSVSWLLLFLFFLHWKMVTQLVGTYLNLRFVALVGSSRPSSVVMVRNNCCESRKRSWFGITRERLNYGLIGDCISCSNKWLVKIWFLVLLFPGSCQYWWGYEVQHWAESSGERRITTESLKQQDWRKSTCRRRGQRTMFHW